MSAPLAGVHCPACGQQTVHVSTVDTLTCVFADCPDTQAAQTFLSALVAVVDNVGGDL